MTSAADSMAVIVLAGGRSARMGADNKLLAPLGGRPLLSYPISAARNAGFSSIRCIIRPGSRAALSAAIEDASVTWIEAEQAALGQSHSLAAGIESLPASCSGALILLGDMPFVTVGHIETLTTATKASETRVIRLTHAARPGHPVYWPRRLFPALCELTGDKGARALLKHEDVVRLHCDDDGCVFDVDTPGALENARKRLDTGNTPQMENA